MSDLLTRARRQEAIAARAGVLHRVTTERHRIDSHGIRWVIHEVGRIDRKLELTASQRRNDANPFANPETELVVERVSSTHLAVLNKFPVLDTHLLIITEHFEPQNEPLSHADFDAIRRCLSEIDGLVFFNSSATAGASQEHKHLQLVTLPFGFGPGRTPIDHLLEPLPRDEVVRAPPLRFAHAVQQGVDPSSWLDTERLQEAFRSLYEVVSRGRRDQPFNLLITRRWMMVVPRVLECFEDMSVNALGFVGSLLVRDHGRLARVREIGPLAMLDAVAGCNLLDDRPPR